MPVSTLSPTLSLPIASRAHATDLPSAWESTQLFGEARTVFIDHGGQRYTLRITRENKLILTK